MVSLAWPSTCMTSEQTVQREGKTFPHTLYLVSVYLTAV